METSTSLPEEVGLSDYLERKKEDYNKLLPKDKEIIDAMLDLFKNLTEDGVGYWEEYYT